MSDRFPPGTKVVPPRPRIPPGTKVFVTGAAGFIGASLCRALRGKGYYVIGADIQLPAYDKCEELCDEFHLADLRDEATCVKLARPASVIFHLAADMGGMGFIGNKENDRQIMLNNMQLTKNVATAASGSNGGGSRKIVVYTSSACVYPKHQQGEAECKPLHEDDAFPADPEDCYGWEKLNGERTLMAAISEDCLRIARLHNVFGPKGTWVGGREKAPAAFCRKALACSPDNTVTGNDDWETTMSIWGDGKQTRTFLYIDDCVDALLCLGLTTTFQDPTNNDNDNNNNNNNNNNNKAIIVNVGTDELVSMNDFARMILNMTGRSKVQIVNDESGPRGVVGRNCNFERATQLLDGWRPKLTLHQGLERTWPWIKSQMDAELTSASSEAAAVALRKSWTTSQRATSIGSTSISTTAPHASFGVLLPITSRKSHSPAEFWSRIKSFASHLAMASKGDPFWPTMKIFVGLDDDDPLLGFHDEGHERPLQGRDDLQKLLEDECCCRWPAVSNPVQVVSLSGQQFQRGAICQYWRHLAKTAYDAECTHFVLLGDDVDIKSRRWMAAVYQAFVDLSTEISAPVGFGCVAIKDEAAPAFPTFPVLTRTHLDIFGSDGFFPSVFVNQDGDPFLFQLYRRWGASKLIDTATLVNNIGGFGEARYTKQHTRWTGKVLSDAVERVQTWLDNTNAASKQLPTRRILVDVLVPTFRCNFDLLKAILDLKVAPKFNCDLGFVIVVDRPIDEVQDCWDRLKAAYGSRINYRIRSQEKNTGASSARNRALRESSADYIVFLDDDIKPSAGIINAYVAAFLAHPDKTGFAGPAILPGAKSARSRGARMAGVTYFWNYPSRARSVPWAVTANVAFKRNADIEFDLIFPKTGGGEDIDYCLKVANGEMVSVPEATAVHPWWNDNRPHLSRFWGWADGDGVLVQLYPQYTYWAPMNLAETAFCGLTLLAVFLSCLALFGFSVSTAGKAVAMTLFGIVACAVGDLLHEAYFQLWQDSANHQDEASGMLRVEAVPHAWLVRTASELGRLWGHLKRRKPQLIAQRFDWFVGSLPNARSHERKMLITRWGFWVATMAVAAHFASSWNLF